MDDNGDEQDDDEWPSPNHFRFNDRAEESDEEGEEEEKVENTKQRPPSPDTGNEPARIPLPRVEVELDPDAEYYTRSQSPHKPLSREITLHVNVVSKYLWTNKFVDIPNGFFDGVDDELKRLVIVGRRRVANMEAYKTTRSLSTAKTYDLAIYNARGSPNHYHSSKNTNPECNNTTAFSRAPSSRFQTPPPRLSSLSLTPSQPLSPSPSTSTFSRQSSLYSSQSPD